MDFLKWNTPNNSADKIMNENIHVMPQVSLDVGDRVFRKKSIRVSMWESTTLKPLLDTHVNQGNSPQIRHAHLHIPNSICALKWPTEFNHCHTQNSLILCDKNFEYQRQN